MAVWGAVPVAAVVPLFTAGTYRHYRGTTTHCCRLFGCTFRHYRGSTTPVRTAVFVYFFFVCLILPGMFHASYKVVWSVFCVFGLFI